jgi:sulfotransferase family protein
MPKYVYICSAGHSGSTLLDLLLGSHSQVTSLGEIDQLSKNLALNTVCSCGVPVRACAVWKEVILRVASNLGIDIMADPYCLHLGYPKASVVIDHSHQTSLYLLRREFILGLTYLHLRTGIAWPGLPPPSVAKAIDNNIAVFESVRSVLRTDMVVDSSKSYLKAISLYQRCPDDVRVLLLTRDGRGVYASNLKRGKPRAKAIRDWRNQYVRALPLLQKHVQAAHWMQIRYEDLTTDTVGTVRRICGLLDLPFEAQMLDFRRKTHHVANGNDMRFLTSAHIEHDEQWRTGLKPGDLEYFDRKAGWLNEQLGYT